MTTITRRMLPLGAVLLVLLASLAAGTARADHAGTPYTGNPSCEQRGYDHGHKINEQNPSGTYDFTDPDFTVEVDSEEAAEGWFFSFWNADPAVDAVLVKGGNGGVEYAFPGGADAASDMHAMIVGGSGKYAAVSHVEFCFGERDEEPERFEIELVKLWFDEDGDPVPAPDSDVVTLDADGEDPIHEGSSVTLEAETGYDVSEDLDGDWAEMDACPEEALNDVPNTVIGEGTGEDFEATEAGAHVVCNQETSDDPGGGTPGGGSDPDPETAAEPEVEILAEVLEEEEEDEEEIRPTRVDSGTGGLLGATAAASLLALVLAGLGLSSLGLGLRMGRSND